MDAATLHTARRNMVEYQIRCCKVLNQELIDLLFNAPREKFVPEHVASLAYMEGSVPLPCGQEMLTPLQEAQILQALNLKGTEKVLEIGTGAGYLTYLLSLLSEQVVSCELHEELYQLARKNLSENGVDNATLIHVNAMDEEALAASGVGKDFDVIVISAALTRIPGHIQALLKESGQLIAFIGEDIVTLEHHQFTNGMDIKKGITETHILPMEGLAKQREFVF